MVVVIGVARVLTDQPVDLDGVDVKLTRRGLASDGDLQGVTLRGFAHTRKAPGHHGRAIRFGSAGAYRRRDTS
jgi:hypothetical protein